LHRQVAVIVDTDPGIDDAVALALAACAPEIALCAVTTTYGNATLPVTTRNARYILELAGRGDVPVVAGSAGPLVRAATVGDPVRHGPEGLGHVKPGIPARHDEAGSPLALLEAFAGLPDGTRAVLVTLGPLTNLAWALLSDGTALRRRIAGHVAILGKFCQRGDSPQPDFNCLADLRAAEVVLNSGLPTSIVPLNVSGCVRVTEGDVARCLRASVPLTRTLGRAIAYPEGAARPIHDAVAVAALLAPDVLDFGPRRLKIDQAGGPAAGGLREADDGPVVEVASGVDVSRVRDVLARVLPIA
jgi:purine nucleosidase